MPTAFEDRELAADILTRLYTDFPAGRVLVADSGGLVVAYLAGCFRTAAYSRLFHFRVLPAALAAALRRGTLVHRWFWGVAPGILRSRLAHRRMPAPLLAEYAAHLHINILPGFRGAGLGRALVTRFIELAAREKVTGVHVSVRADNIAGRRFFERMGFSILVPAPPIRREDAPKTLFRSVLYGKRI